MAWRASYALLLEIFPQVDARIIKGAALDHGDDLGSAADFILNEVLIPDDDFSDEEQHTVNTTETLLIESSSGSPNAGNRQVTGTISDSKRPDDGLTDQEQFAVNAKERLVIECQSGWRNAGNQQVTGNISDAECSSGILTGRISENVNEVCVSCSMDGSGVGQEAFTDLICTCCKRGILEVSSKEEDTAVRPVASFGTSEVTSPSVDSHSVDVLKNEVPQLFLISEPGGEHTQISNLSAPSTEAYRSEDELLAKSSGDVNIVEPETTGDEEGGSLELCGTESSNLRGVSKTEENKNSDNIKEMLESVCLGSTYTDPENSDMEDSNLRDCEISEEEMIVHSVYDSVIVSRSKMENDTILEEDGLEVMASTNLSFEEEDGTREGCWETDSNSSTLMVSMETLLKAVEQAKTDKEVLISSIEELRALRHQTDQAEFAAREAKLEAESGGVEIMGQVLDMRQMIRQTREANEVHAAELHGEKAVLATEAKELRCRLVKLKNEKEKALSMLNEIKASLQARIAKACQERVSAAAEKSMKEALAQKSLMEEEALMAKVAEESKELQAETETCNTLRESLIERGNIVDALQGEVAVLCEDAEELKEEVERMSVLWSAGYLEMLRPRPLIDSNNSSFSGSSKVAVSSEGAEDLEFPLEFPLDSEVVANSPARSVGGGQRNAGDKRLPSLRQALSGSQDLSGSSLSSVNSMTGPSNSAVSLRSVTKVSTDIGDGSRFPEEKYFSPRSSQSGSAAERRLYRAQISIFPNEESDLSFRTNNLDIFRTENSGTTKRSRGASSDEDDWHLLDLKVESKHSSSESSCDSRRLFTGRSTMQTD